MIERNYNQSLLNAEPPSQSLVHLITEIDQSKDLGDCAIYHEFPFYRDTTGDSLIRANVLFISKKYGILIFQCYQVSSRETLDQAFVTSTLDNLEALDTLIFSKLIKSELLKKTRRDLKFDITPAVYLTEDDKTFDTNFDIVSSQKSLQDLIIHNNAGSPLSEIEFNELKSLLEGSKVIPRKNERILKDGKDLKHSKGAILSRIESEIANFDTEQKRAALFTLDSPQRIRGLAGSGKTIILAMKAALIHIQEPSADILYTYYTKALNDYVKRLITRFYRMFAEQDPNWDKIHIIHAWGGYSIDGVYYNAALYNNIPPLNLTQAKARNPDSPFSYICEELVKSDLKIQYDYALLDEAQDFPKPFYQLCRKITKNNRVIWAYDDFQNILDVEIQNERETFGKDEKGEYYIDFSKKNEILQDLVLHKCYRNPRKNLIAAFALGLGIYNDNQKILQRLENNAHWESLGFTVEQGDSNTGSKMIISRPQANSPLIKNELLEKGIFNIKSFPNIQEECSAVAAYIIEDISQELLPEDIAVISLDNRYTRRYFELISSHLQHNGIKIFSLVQAPTDNIIYKTPGHVTLSTIYKAKGNESGSVYVVGIDAVFANKDSIKERNKLFTAITRSEAWVTLTGVGNLADLCAHEYQILERNDFRLIFTQPSKESTRTIYQEISKRQEKLNEIERITEELKKLGLSPDELKSKLLSLVSPKK